MITVPFSIQELCDSGEEVFLSVNDVCEKVAFFKNVFCGVFPNLVALRMSRSSELVCTIAALVEMHTPFIMLKPEDDPVLLGARFLFDGSQLTEIHSVSHTCINDADEDEEFCYFISTSGTTGAAKLVGVPYSCIGPNIEDFRERFIITSNDVILCSTSFFFDPSMVELLLAFTSGSRLLLVPDRVRSQPHVFASVLRRYIPTFVQLTPSVLSLLDEVTVSWMLGDHSLIRWLLVGGEKFPFSLVKRFRTSSNPTRIFNVYGVTEVSCWATIAEISFNYNLVNIGSPLKCTTISLTDSNEILIGGSRKCRVNGTWNKEYTATGDIVQDIDGKLVLVGRTDDQIKLKGVRCNLAVLSEQVHAIKGVFFANFLLYKDKFLVLFVVSENVIDDSLQQIIPSPLIPSKVIYLDRVPVNPNGKVDRSKLIAILEEQCSNQIKSWSAILTFLSKFGIESTVDLSFHSFVDYAAEIALHLGNADALRDILDTKLSVVDVFRKYTSHSMNTNNERNADFSRVVTDVPVISSPQPDITWACDTERCIDGAPLLSKLDDEDVIAACSHSGFVVCVRLRDGCCLWKTRISCRFQASPTRCGEHFVVGGYDGGVYFLSAHTGVTEWRFSCGDVVKAACSIDDFHNVYVPAYDRKLYKIDPKHRKCVWSRPIQSGSPASAIVLKKNVFVTTIKGSLEAIDTETGLLLWLYQAQAPIFSSVAIFGCSGYIGSVDGMVTKICLDNGKKEGVASTSEPIFARISIFDSLLYIVTQRGSFFIADLVLHILRCFYFPFCSFVVPVINIRHTVVGLVSSSGLFIVFNQNDRKAHAFRIGEGQVYSPVILSNEKNYLVAGCRDDWLRCFKLPIGFLDCKQ